MAWVFGVIKVLHIIVSLFLILVVLLQAGKGAGVGFALGGASQAVFGGGGATTFLAKLTWVMAFVFMVTSMSLAWRSSRQGSSALKGKSVPTSPEKLLEAGADEDQGTGDATGQGTQDATAQTAGAAQTRDATTQAPAPRTTGDATGASGMNPSRAAGQGTPTDGMAVPAARPMAPATRATAPRPMAPATRATAPAARPMAPAARAMAPAARAMAPAARPMAPAARPMAPAARPMAPAPVR